MPDVISDDSQGGSASAATGKRHRFVLSLIRIELVDCDGEAIPDEKFELYCDGKRVAEGKLDYEGRADLQPRSSGKYEVEFPDLQQGSWKPSGSA